ncbi:MAG TPA: thioredoxin family protein [Kofleriaceae bacterium]|nr:thioredoxin family protein [Kofleriaceae bacterium]
MKLVVAALAIASACGPREAPLAWQTSETAAFARARSEHAAVMVETYASWSMPSVELDRRLHGEAAATALAGAFVPLRVDVSNSTDADQALRDRYRITSEPAVVFVDADGTVLGRIDRLVEEPELVRAIADAAGRRKR